mgnify:CR=1 FL=1
MMRQAKKKEKKKKKKKAMPYLRALFRYGQVKTLKRSRSWGIELLSNHNDKFTLQQDM